MLYCATRAKYCIRRIIYIPKRDGYIHTFKLSTRCDAELFASRLGARQLCESLHHISTSQINKLMGKRFWNCVIANFLNLDLIRIRLILSVA